MVTYFGMKKGDANVGAGIQNRQFEGCERVGGGGGGYKKNANWPDLS